MRVPTGYCFRRNASISRFTFILNSSHRLCVVFQLTWVFLTKKVKQDVICCLADSGIVCQDFIAKPCGIAVGQFFPDAVQKVVGIVVEDIIVPYEGHLAENAYSYLTSVLSQYTTNRCRPPLA